MNHKRVARVMRAAGIRGYVKRRRPVSDHARSWMRHQTFTDPLHADAARTLRRQHRALASMLAGAAAEEGLEKVQVEERRLADYDELFGLVEPTGQPLRSPLGSGDDAESGVEGGVA